MTTTPNAGQAATAGTAPPAFPVTWDTPSDATYCWTHQRMHFPDPITPLDAWLITGEFAGATTAAQVYALPISGTARRINTYAYATIIQRPVPLEQREAQERLAAAMGRLAEEWRTQWLPEIQAHLAFWADFDLGGASLPALRAHLDETIARRQRLWDLHFLVWFPAYTAISLFDDFYREQFGATDGFGAVRLLQGFPNKTVETTQELWTLSRQALGLPEVRRVLEETAAAEVLTALDRSPDGPAFRAALDAYLAEYGQRFDKWLPSSPSWIEDPTPVIKNLKDYVGQPARDLPAELAAQAVAREQAVADARRRLGGSPQPVLDQFEVLLKAAQEGTVLTEDHGFWIDLRGWYPIRRLLLEFGHRFAAAGVLDGPDDIFYLELDELVAMAEARPWPDRRALIGGRKAEMAYFRTVQPPAALGTMPSGPPADDPVSRTLGKFFGPPPPAPLDGQSVRGNAGSPGRVRGRAKVIRALRDAGKLEPGDVLVAETTAPPWTPLFATAGAIVTDTGGMLSHGAIVAREYRIPAVVGTGSATAVFHDGQLLEVDGDAGTVRLVTEE